jgi:beta-mannosidase
MAQWEKSISKADWAKDSPAVRWHDKTGKEWEKFYGYVTTHYPAPESLEDWTYYSQLNQRDALRYGIEHWRRTDYCQGTLIWQFNDCWPVQCWSVQDYLRLLKPAGYELKRLYADRLISLLRTDGKMEITLVNDGALNWAAELKVEVFSVTDGASLSTKQLSAEISSGARVKIDELETEAFGSALVRVTTKDGNSAVSLTREPKDTEFGTPEFQFEVAGEELKVTVKGVAVDLVVIDPEDPFNLLPAGTDLPGACAVTLINESTSYPFDTKPRKVTAEWLHGRQEFEVD